MSKLMIEQFECYEKFKGVTGKIYTYYNTDVVTKIIHGKEIIYIVAIELDYEYEKGYQTKIYSEEEFNAYYSRTRIHVM